MNALATRISVVTSLAATAIVTAAVPVAAQVEQSDIGSEQGGLETSQLITSSAEVRRAVIGLLIIAAVALIVFVVYWALTGRAARQRFSREFGGRHAVDTRPRRGRRGRAAAPSPDAQPATAVAPGSVEPPRRRMQAQAQPVRSAGAAEAQIHPGWVDSGGGGSVPVKVHPAWVDQSTPAPVPAAGARHAAPAHDPDRPWRDTGDGPWPRPFEGH